MGDRILVTGSTGNVGSAVVDYLRRHADRDRWLTDTRSTDPGPGERYLDLRRPECFAPALRAIDRLFLLRPPAVSDTQSTFRPLVEEARRAGVRYIVYLSVEGADRIPFIPHHKIERLIADSTIAHTFLRPTYFMQNLTTTLRDEVASGTLRIPAGRAVFNWVDARDIGRTAGRLLLADHGGSAASAITLAGPERYDFATVAALVREQLSIDLHYRSRNPLSYVYNAWRRGKGLGYAATVAAIHFAQRFQSPTPPNADWLRLLGKEPITLIEFLHRERARFPGGGKA